jgi:HAD superfamily hydrolase (TIGR01484 family)
MEKKMSEQVLSLLSKVKVAVISGSSFPVFDTNILHILPNTSENFSNLLLLPNSGTRLYTWRGSWNEQYAEHLSPAEKEKVTTALKDTLGNSGVMMPVKTYGDTIEDRGSQITFSALGQSAPLEIKNTWDATKEKREKIVDLLKIKLPEFEIRIGGTTSIDITKRGVNKAYGIRKIEEILKIPPDKILFIGDKLMGGGNDFPAKATGVDCIQVNGPEETEKLIEDLLK